MHAMLYVFLFLPAVLVLALLAVQVRQRRLHAAEPRAVVRVASLDDSREIAANRSWRLGVLATAAPMLGSAALLKLRWQTIPERFPIHWGIHGQPDGWTQRSGASVYGMLLVAALLVAAMALVGELTVRSSPGYQGRSAMLRTMRGVLLAASWFVTLLLCGVSLLPLAHDPTNLVPFLTFGSILFSVGLLVFVGYRSFAMSDAITASQNSTDDRFWKAGLFYVNAQDSALMVPKRYGFGYTLNFGRPVSWLIFAAILLIPLVLPVLLHLSAKH